MIQEEIISEDYADLIAVYYGDLNNIQPIADSIITPINYVYALVNIPAADVNYETVSKYGYSMMPKIYGLASIESLVASGVERIREIPNFNLRGNGVLIGIVDTGIDYTNPIFQYADGTTRIVALWDQTIQTGIQPEGMPFGSMYLREDINRALQSENPFDIVPSRDTNGHGTMLAGIAGGNVVEEQQFSGVAPEVEFVIVKLKEAKTVNRSIFFVPEGVPCYQETDLMFGLDFLVNQSNQLDKSISICFGIGSAQGAHDGRGDMARYISQISNRRGVICNVAAGNEGNARRHYRGVVNREAGFITAELNIGSNENNFAMELWGENPSIGSVDIQSPSGEFSPRIDLLGRDYQVVRFLFENTIVHVNFQLVERATGRQLILFRFQSPAEGIWRFRVYDEGNLSANFSMWLPMTGFITDNTYFIQSDPYITILDLGNAPYPITVTAYNHVDNSLYQNAGRGYNADNYVKPELAAPGVNITGPNLTQGFTTYTGTGAATAHLTGISALLLEWGIVRGNLSNMSTVEVKKLLIRGARRTEGILYPNRDWGYGTVDIYNVFDRLRVEYNN